MDEQTDKLTCKRCKESLKEKATLCPHCGSEQVKSFRALIKEYGTPTGLFISIMMMLVAIVTLYMASQERADSKTAVAKARVAIEKVRKLEKITAKRAENIKRFQTALLSGKKTTVFEFLRDPNDKLLPLHNALPRIGSDHGGAYELAFWLENSIPKASNPAIKALRKTPDAYYFKLFEVMIISWLYERYKIHWVVENEEMHRFGLSSRRRASYPKDSYLHPVMWSKEDIKHAFSDNPLFAFIPSHRVDAISLPPGTKVSVTASKAKLERSITFANPQLDMTLTFKHRRVHEVSDLSKKAFRFEEHFKRTDPNFKSTEPTYAQRLNVTFSYKFNPDQSISALTAKQQKWIEGMIRQFNQDFSWWSVEKDLRTFPIAIDAKYKGKQHK